MSAFIIWTVLLAALLAGRINHPVTIARMQLRRRPTHVCLVGLVAYVRHQNDGDIHVTLVNQRNQKVIAEIIPLIPLVAPRKGQKIEVCGITRRDEIHGWPEIHPVESWKGMN